MKLKETLRSIIREEIVKVLNEGSDMNKISEIRNIVSQANANGNMSDINALAKQIKKEATFPLGIKLNVQPQGQFKGMKYIQITSGGKRLCRVALANKPAYIEGFELSTRPHPLGDTEDLARPKPPLKKFDVGKWVIYFDYFTQ
jgi:predicted Zn-ribbon and HTH transcriptional regulator